MKQELLKNMEQEAEIMNFMCYEVRTYDSDFSEMPLWQYEAILETCVIRMKELCDHALAQILQPGGAK